MYNGEAGFTKLGPGSSFGDFFEAKGRLYKPQCIVSMSEPLRCIMIKTKELKELFEKIETHENL